MSGTAYIGGNPGAGEDIYVREPVHKHTDLSVTGGTVEGNVRIEFGANLGMTQESLKPVANSVVKEGGVFEGHIQVRIDNTEGTSVDYSFMAELPFLRPSITAAKPPSMMTSP